MKIFSKGFNFSQDGPGNRLVYHLKGCNMHCLWCSNPEGMSSNGGKGISEDEIIAECISCKPMFFSGGGVTFTGGEATLQHNELKNVLCALQKNGIHTCIETNGTDENLLELSPFIDYLIMDFKHFDSAVLKKFTGIGNECIKKNFEGLTKENRQLHIRIPLINGFNAENPQSFCEYFKFFANKNTVFEFLPYHEYGKEKWQTEYKIKNGFISAETLKNFTDAFKANGLKVVNT